MSKKWQVMEKLLHLPRKAGFLGSHHFSRPFSSEALAEHVRPKAPIPQSPSHLTV